MPRTVTVKMGDALLARLEETAKKLGTSRSELIRTAVSRFLAEVHAGQNGAQERRTVVLVCPHCGKAIRIRLDLALARFNGNDNSQSHPPQ